jgi:phosphatidylserine/phosphatidylglycerophosphate/cardiolipin synthase-like enzyme
VVAAVAALALALLLATGSRGTSDRAARPTPAAAAVGTYTPVTGAIFNRPVGTAAEQRRIFTHVNRTIDSAPAGSTIRIAVFSFSEKVTADKLLAAKRRGVNVQLVFDDHTISSQMKRLRAGLGKNPAARSFVVYCHLSCRGTGGNMHDKIFTFSRAGSAENITMIGSNNMTAYNATRQWSDIYTIVNDPAMYFTVSGVFDQLKTDRARPRSYYQADIDGYEAQFYPYANATQYVDPLYLALSKVACTGAAPGTGVNGQTLVRLSQHAWNGNRGIYLARKVAELQSQGCVVQVVYGVGVGTTVRGILSKAGVQLRANTQPGIRTHQKILPVSGVYDGRPDAQVVFTGSSNWSDGALKRDETVLRISDPAAYAQYAQNFEDIWNNG